MARTTKSIEKPSSNALIPWDEQLAKDAEISAGMEANSGGGQFFSVRGGVLSFNDAPVAGNQMAVVILDTVFENVFYEGKYDPNNPTPPTCFAFGRDELTMGPHQTVVDRKQDQHSNCQGCPMNAWGTADTGRGKACRNTRRLGIIPAGTLNPETNAFKAFDDKTHFAQATVGYLKPPVTSIKGYATFVKQIAAALKRPPHGIFTRVKVLPDPASQFKVVFEPLAKVPDHLMPTIMERRAEVVATIDFPYNLDMESSSSPVKGGRGAGKNISAASNKPPIRRGKY